MVLTKRDLVTWMKLVQLIAQMTLAAVAALKDDDPVDFDAVKIRVTPEEALQRARVEQERKADSSRFDSRSPSRATDEGLRSE